MSRWIGAALAGMLLCAPWLAMAEDAPNPIKAGDLLYVNTLRLPEFSTNATVTPQGTVKIPLVGEVPVAGMSEKEAAGHIEQALKKYVRNPHVTVSRTAPAYVGGARTAQMKTELVPLNNSNAEKLSEQLAGMSSDGGAISYDDSTNTLILTDTPQVLQNMMSVITRLDQMQSQLTQVRIEAKIAEVQVGALKDLGLRWFIQDQKWGAGYIPGLRQDVRINGLRGNNGSALNNENIGGGSGFGNNNNNTGRRFINQDNFHRRLQIPVQVATAGQFLLGFFDGTVDMGALLDALVADNKAQLLANPNVLTVNHKKAHIEMVDEFPIPEFGTEASGRSTTSIRYEDIGIVLDVTPHVMHDKSATYVALDLHPDVSFPSGSSNGVPIISRRTADTEAHVRNGQTLVIGGIYRNDMQNTVQKVPMLGQLPVLGNFFKRKENSNVQTELMVFVTPTVHQNPESVTWDRMINIDDPRDVADATGKYTRMSGEQRRN